tara:strand:+ start:707 stop:886 length:180 start_codon:yes stop_codon:yes gene_type:complete
MSKHKEEKGFDDGYKGLDIAMPDNSGYLAAYGRGYEQAEKDSYFAEQWLESSTEDNFSK